MKIGGLSLIFGAVLAVLFGVTAMRANANGPSDRGGNGGYGVVCRDSVGELISVQLLDLHEAEESEVPESAEPAQQQVHQALDRLSSIGLNWADGAIWSKLLEIRRRTRPVEDGFYFEFTRDARSKTPLLGGCRREQLAVFRRDTSELLVRRRLLDRLSKTQQAAFELHEAVYAVQTGRDHPLRPNSDRARAFVRALLNPRSSAESLALALNFKTREQNDVSWSFARQASRGKRESVSCAAGCTAKELAGDYLLVLGAAGRGVDCALQPDYIRQRWSAPPLSLDGSSQVGTRRTVCQTGKRSLWLGR